MKNKKIFLLILALVVIFILINAIFLAWYSNKFADKNVKLYENYNPVIKPSDFTAKITNKYFSMPIGKKMIYEAKKSGGVERIEIVIPGATRKIMGVETLVFWDRVYLNNELIEDTRDYIAQDKEGNVWYFGEDVDNYKNGVLKDHSGAWIAGINGAKPGIWMKANPRVGDEYRQEYYKGEAEDIGKVVSLNEKVSTTYGTFYDCIKILEYTPLEPGAIEYKYPCSEVGAIALEEKNNERVGLIDVQYNVNILYNPQENVNYEPEVSKSKTRKTEEEAKSIALKSVPGRVTDITVEMRSGKENYVVEIDADNGPETDVIIDIETGEILGIET